MKRRDLIAKLVKSGWWIKNDKGPHTTYTNGTYYGVNL
jgi:predicted RNA binding protein YcfA (HicA-like mRNA interferase family)